MKANGAVNPILRSYFASLGKKGGASKSPRKMSAIRANLAKAHAKQQAKAKAVAG